VETSDLLLEILIGSPPSPQTFTIELKQTGLVWRYMDENPGNLKGTYRTLDNRDGTVPLEPGILSRQGCSIVDDSTSLVFNDCGWHQPLPGARPISLTTSK
jgi:hypothetical protein